MVIGIDTSILTATIGSSETTEILLRGTVRSTPMATECCRVWPLFVCHVYFPPKMELIRESIANTYANAYIENK